MFHIFRINDENVANETLMVESLNTTIQFSTSAYNSNKRFNISLRVVEIAQSVAFIIEKFKSLGCTCPEKTFSLLNGYNGSLAINLADECGTLSCYWKLTAPYELTGIRNPHLRVHLVWPQFTDNEELRIVGYEQKNTQKIF